ncbi:MAG: STAS domain-containing protein [Deltaproteobacteria bacterium]|nr:STAS domain-containing protein [Deltaproteobacteria bacterium]
MDDQVFFAQHDNVFVFKLVGNIRFTICPGVEQFLQKLFAEQAMCPIIVDMTETTGIDSTALGLLAQMAMHSRKELDLKPTLLVVPGDVLTVIKSMSFDTVFSIVQEADAATGAFTEIHPVDVGEKDMIGHILAAHRTLMGLSDENRGKFENVLKVLEKEMDGD